MQEIFPDLWKLQSFEGKREIFSLFLSIIQIERQRVGLKSRPVRYISVFGQTLGVPIQSIVRTK